ncbi:MAG: methyltransferase domain-containing protein [Armatimonadota bacterium]
MKDTQGIGLCDVQSVYSGPVGDLWELIMGHQIHIGGFKSSMDLAEKAKVAGKGFGLDLCCCNGAGMRFLLRFQDVKHMHGVDATEEVMNRAQCRCREEGFSNRATFTLADVCNSGIPDSIADFIWGEDAWCYVEDKPQLIAEAARLVKPGGTIAFTDWIEGPSGLTKDEADRFMWFMKFPNLQDTNGYCDLLTANGCDVQVCEDTGRYAPCIDLYLAMLDMQLTSDALRIIGYDTELFKALAGEMMFIQELAHAGKIIQGLFVARKKD